MLIEPQSAPRALAPRRSQAGLSLVEMMVGIAVGLFVVAGATMVVATQLTDNRRLLLETQLQQDIRAAADLITRELRRSGAVTLASAHAVLWSPTVAAQPNNLIGMVPDTGTTSNVGFTYARSASQVGADYGFRLQAGAIQTLQGTAGWQPLTDRSTMEVTAFTVTFEHEPPMTLPCQQECPGGGTDCWPELQVRRVSVDIQARAASDPGVVRALRSTVRLRADRLLDDAGGTPACP